jgi:hypothetical protein
MTIQETHDNKDKMFWSYLSRICKSRTLPFYKLLSDNKVLSEQEEIMTALHKYYKEQFNFKSKSSLWNISCIERVNKIYRIISTKVI